ncbi:MULTISPECIES: DUF6114 domain-containing protein [unclassified Cryobacterium]|uniref:DUF6114 domain-containing protein n=1 Tax=unclassified Cryobacterium TaxID=2649013 RepID=UPI002AB592A1|nr:MULTISPECIES: DUF6114 domain-containing protein [unclassified Cryobacterium]MDY7543411.1 DUF6114 domain-containing protein [Cryobacterium sp. 5B3]MEB0264944.1 DUF6114 domain-containing protein [Cryobacterium sp. 10I5]MEB0274733.1 DUF6114 domain-containing protein [Cryobacterium sp. 5B3]
MKTSTWATFTGWCRQRPFVGGILVVLAGVEMFFSGQLDVGSIHVQVGVEGMQAMIIPVIVVLVGILAIGMPVHRIFYGVIALVFSIYSLVGVNLGGFFVGMILSAVGGILVVAWMPKPTRAGTAVELFASPVDEPAIQLGELVEERSRPRRAL